MNLDAQQISPEAQESINVLGSLVGSLAALLPPGMSITVKRDAQSTEASADITFPNGHTNHHDFKDPRTTH